MSLTRTDWLMIAKTLRDTKPADVVGPDYRRQWEIDCEALADVLEANAERQWQKFDAGRFLRDCGYTSD